MYIKKLSESLSENEYGGKGSGLSKMLSFGIAVPKGFCIHKLAKDKYLTESAFQKSFKDMLLKNLNDLKSSRVIIRSSAIGEDSQDFSFAGQLDSIVVDNDFEDVLKAIIECWDSINNERVKAYQNRVGYNLAGIGVVVQEFIEAEYSGVLFTESPNNSSEIYLEYVEGAGELLVSGKVTPESMTIQKESDFAINNNLPFNVMKLLNVSMGLQKKLNKQLDIEWIAKDNDVFFVQVRPITTKAKSKVYWTNTNLNENYPRPISHLLYSIARDSYYHYFKNLAKLLRLKDASISKCEYYFSNSVGIFGNRIYYNMTSINEILSLSPFKSFFKNAFNTFIGYENSSKNDGRAKELLAKLSVLFNIIKLNINLLKNVEIIEKKVDAYSESVSLSKEYQQYAYNFYEFLNLRFNQWYHSSLADMFAMLYYKLLNIFTSKVLKSKHSGVHNILIQAIPNLISSKPLIHSWEIIEQIKLDDNIKKAFENENSTNILNLINNDEKWTSIKLLFDEYLNKWGFRCSEELMLTSDNYIMNPEKFVELLQSYLKFSKKSPKDLITEKRKESKEAYYNLTYGIIKKWNVLFPISAVLILMLFSITKLCKNSIAYRERVRYKQAQMYNSFSVTIRNIAKIFESKKIIDSIDDIYYLSYKEIGELISSSSMNYNIVKETILLRKEEYLKQCDQQYESNICSNFGENAEANIISNIDYNINTELSGLAASGGKIKGVVKVLNSVMEADKLNKGDILVTKQTDPGWAVVFPLIGGLIVELGGALSHGSIVAREFGIPAVVGVSNITHILKDNDVVVLDGNLGKIQKIY